MVDIYQTTRTLFRPSDSRTLAITVILKSWLQCTRAHGYQVVNAKMVAEEPPPGRIHVPEVHVRRYR